MMDTDYEALDILYPLLLDCLSWAGEWLRTKSRLRPDMDDKETNPACFTSTFQLVVELFTTLTIHWSSGPFMHVLACGGVDTKKVSKFFYLWKLLGLWKFSKFEIK